MRQRLSADTYSAGILSGDRVMLSRAITVIESHLPEDRILAGNILKAILPHTGQSFRIGITGVPGVGKSTFIETLGNYVIDRNKKVAVLTIDPSSKKSGGSILADKTRMEKLSRSPGAFIRPSASNSFTGGVARNTRESILLCEAAAYDIIIVETVGVGQSETMVKGMTDFFLLLMLSGAGDELQGIKRGIMEMADAIAINKADGDNMLHAENAAQEYRNALHLFPASASGFQQKVVTCSAKHQTGIDTIWEVLADYQQCIRGNGFFERNRKSQNKDWMHDSIRYALESEFYKSQLIRRKIKTLEKAVEAGTELPLDAAEELLRLFFSKINTTENQSGQ
ncbi:methylmalonyl Co-A mutase-associated GTPase MeaB [Dyadobacter luteus]|uniref:Methylmalonyl Co-A mutase-associated GTPase MeaB n=1 Tax=Dyadobacter luteus TaxID=2259619 RepID=A0A3D8YB73_9BACT|nr:methylmalonyl Co-A mutase-associated GTPase MeaB [Dyadobacter luteus]REA59294.1 methylmalonyl Co-A mutase-associated GTPase MeaB [Dyadobacter luteus]